MTTGLTLLDKLWTSHEIVLRDDGVSLLWVDRHWVHEGSHHAFAKLKQRGLTVAETDLTFGVSDHYVPTQGRNSIQDGAITTMLQTLANNTNNHNITHFDPAHHQQGIVHVIGPELGLTLPGLLINCGDSHTSTHGAFGCLSFGIGATEVAHVLATQTLWQRKPKAMRLYFDGALPEGVSAKDLALHWISTLGAHAAQGFAVEYSGSTISKLGMEGRMTLCNMSIEGGARFGMVAPDETTFNYLKNRPYTPLGEQWSSALEDWRKLHSDETAEFEQEHHFDVSKISPTVTWGTSPAQAIGIDKTIPEIDSVPEPGKTAYISDLEYMALDEGQSLIGIPIDRVFIGSCTNARLDDLQAAAAILKNKRSKVPGLVSPGSSGVKRQAERLGLDKVFTDAGLTWVDSGCSSCVAMNGDAIPARERCASTTNRNFRGRQGPLVRTHLMSPAMVAAAAVNGCISDVRQLSHEEVYP